MKLTKSKLKQIIKEEIENIQNEGFLDKFSKKGRHAAKLSKLKQKLDFCYNSQEGDPKEWWRSGAGHVSARFSGKEEFLDNKCKEDYEQAIEALEAGEKYPDEGLTGEKMGPAGKALVAKYGPSRGPEKKESWEL
jgi:hypothetical protein